MTNVKEVRFKDKENRLLPHCAGGILDRASGKVQRVVEVTLAEYEQLKAQGNLDENTYYVLPEGTPVAGGFYTGQMVSSLVPIRDAGLHLLDGTRLAAEGTYADFVAYMAAVKDTLPKEEQTFTQPILTQNGTLDGSSFAVYCNSYGGVGEEIGDAYQAFDGRDDTYWSAIFPSVGDNWNPLMIYNPDPLKVTAIEIQNKTSDKNVWPAETVTVYGCNTKPETVDNIIVSEATELCTVNNTVTASGASWTIPLPENTGYYKYYVISFQRTANKLVACAKVTLSAVYETEDSLFTTEAAWQAAVSSTGVCGKFVYNETAGTLRLPKLSAGRQVVESYQNGTQWYRIWNDGWCEQGGQAYLTAQPTTVSLLKPYKSNEYYLGVSNQDTNTDTIVENAAWLSKTANSFSTVNGYDSGRNNIYCDWQACGYLEGAAQPEEPYLYICVATSSKTDVQADIDNIASDLNLKADKDLSNAVPGSSFKTASVGWVQPDYGAGVAWSWGENHTAPSAGVVCFGREAYQTATQSVYWQVNAGNKHYFGGNNGGVCALELLLSAGDVFYAVGGKQNSEAYVYFYPAKGVN